jgi:hypothetical protein
MILPQVSDTLELSVTPYSLTATQPDGVSAGSSRPSSQKETTTMIVRKDRLITRELLDCYRRDIFSADPIYCDRAIKSLKESIERGSDFDTEVTKINALALYSSVASCH